MDQTWQWQITERLAARKPRLLVVGDVMLDHYRIGDAVRISPEAPVPVLLNPRDEYRLGGAGAVAAMCAALGADVTLMGVIGFDREGERLHQMAEAAGIRVALSGVPDRRTTTKLRICAVASGRHRQQLVRLDTETTGEIPESVSDGITDMIGRETFDAAILSDYAKGCITEQIALACIWRGATYVDPPKNQDWEKYAFAECLTPNRDEANGRGADQIRNDCNLTACVVKLDADGCMVATADEQRLLGTWASVVRDPTACGDQFIAALTIARTVGMDWITAARVANAAAGLQVGRYGAVPVTIAELRESI